MYLQTMYFGRICFVLFVYLYVIMSTIENFVKKPKRQSY